MPKDNLDGPNPCHAHACALQTCMQKTWDQDKCKDHLDGLYRCCNLFYQKYLPHDKDATVDACPLPDVTRGKLQAMGEKVLF
ncbi:unnamed protein product [Parajaminaea phylloscopi]